MNFGACSYGMGALSERTGDTEAYNDLGEPAYDGARYEMRKSTLKIEA